MRQDGEEIAFRVLSQIANGTADRYVRSVNNELTGGADALFERRARQRERLKDERADQAKAKARFVVLGELTANFTKRRV